MVGYTNAGKSSLFNALTGADIYAADQLFATLDPTMRKLELAHGADVILADTVGFIRDLPHALVAAFHATLEETQEAALLLHVIDLSDPHWEGNTRAVEAVLAEIGVDAVKQVQVFNKIDALEGVLPHVEHHDGVCRVFISAKTGAGMDLLGETIAQQLHGAVVEEHLPLSVHDAKLRAKLYALGAVIDETLTEEGGWVLHIRMNQDEKDRLMGMHPLAS